MGDFRVASGRKRHPPAGGACIEAFSPKLGRRLRCLSRAAFDLWVCLEADPLVLRFAERPRYLELASGQRLVDFWVERCEGESFLLLDDELEAAALNASLASLPVKCVRTAELAAARVWIDNWQQMLPYMMMCRGLVSSALLDAVARFVSMPIQLSRLEREFAAGDSTLARAAVFSLLHSGKLVAPTLRLQPLSHLTLFEPVP